jgi:tetratricopeptide (TPR) repeat protein
MKSKFVIAALILMAAGAAHAAQKNYCGELANAFGPFDYRKKVEFAQNLRLVESAHFTDDVEQGIKGNAGYLGGDIDYTLRAFPNHHRALATLARVGLREKSPQVSNTKYPVECYFVRAIRFTPDDGAVHAVYGNYLFALGKSEQAQEEFQTAVKLEPENATINYNLGLAYVKANNFDQAIIYAKKAYSLGFPLPGLKNKLIEAGKWTETRDETPK